MEPQKRTLGYRSKSGHDSGLMESIAWALRAGAALCMVLYFVACSSYSPFTGELAALAPAAFIGGAVSFYLAFCVLLMTAKKRSLKQGLEGDRRSSVAPPSLIPSDHPKDG